jgi:hypothetical protein
MFAPRMGGLCFFDHGSGDLFTWRTGEERLVYMFADAESEATSVCCLLFTLPWRGLGLGPLSRLR